MYPILEHPDITSALRTGYPSCLEDEPEILNDEDEEEEETELWGDEFLDDLFEEARERQLFGN